MAKNAATSSTGYGRLVSRPLHRDVLARRAAIDLDHITKAASADLAMSFYRALEEDDSTRTSAVLPGRAAAAVGCDAYLRQPGLPVIGDIRLK